MQPDQNQAIKSFVKRKRKLSPSKQDLFTTMWPIYSAQNPFTNNNAPLAVEIGFGMGNTLFNYAQKYPEINFIGIEVYQPGIVSLFRQLEVSPLDNIRIYAADAVEILGQHIADNSLEKILIFFPDPWQKKRHHKRRLIQPKFIELLHRKLLPNGLLHIATDWQNYAEHISAVLKNNPDFISLDPKTIEYTHLRHDRVVTKFEQRGQKQGHNIHDLLFKKKHRLKPAATL
jgi:tRNA (guanine-N7-)-methyltransferase